MKDEQWPTDLEFRRFAAKLADAVMFSRQRGTVIAPYDMEGNEPGENCPLGCLLGTALPFPTPARLFGTMSTVDSMAFIDGFDRGHGGQRNPYNRLGRAYRKRFVR